MREACDFAIVLVHCGKIHSGSEAIMGKKVIRRIGISFKDIKTMLDETSFIFQCKRLISSMENPKCVVSSAVNLDGDGRGFTAA